MKRTGKIAVVVLAVLASFALGSGTAYDSPANVEACYNTTNCSYDNQYNKGCGGQALGADDACTSNYTSQQGTRTLRKFGCGYAGPGDGATTASITGRSLDSGQNPKLSWTCIIAFGSPDPSASARANDLGDQVYYVKGDITVCPPASICRDLPDAPLGGWEAYVRSV